MKVQSGFVMPHKRLWEPGVAAGGFEPCVAEHGPVGTSQVLAYACDQHILGPVMYTRMQRRLGTGGSTQQNDLMKRQKEAV